MRSDYTEVTKASTARRDISAKERTEAHQAAFGPLLDDVAKGTGLPGDEVLYKDLMGWHTGGKSIDLVSKMYDKVWEDAFTAFNRKVRKGASIYDATRDVIKAADSTQFSLPVFVAPDVNITDREETPFADMVARVAVNESEYKTDELTEHGDVSRFHEPGTNAGTDETWAESDDNYASHQYDIVPYGRQTAVTDFLQLATNTLRSSRAVTDEALARSVRHYEEAQALQGTGSVTGIGGNDANSYDGLPDLAATANVTDEAGAQISKAKVRSNVKDLRLAGGDYDDIVHITDHTTFDDLKGTVDDFVRFESPGNEIDFGFRALNIDGTPVFESHGAPDADGGRLFVSTDMSTVNMAMLQDVTLHPLAKTDPVEDVAVDSYGTLAATAPNDRIVVRHSLA